MGEKIGGEVLLVETPYSYNFSNTTSGIKAVGGRNSRALASIGENLARRRFVRGGKSRDYVWLE